MKHETHYCCDKRLKEEGGNAKCCECHGCPWCKGSASIFSPEDIQAAIRGSNADQRETMRKAKQVGSVSLDVTAPCVQCHREMIGQSGIIAWAAPFCAYSDCPNYGLLQAGKLLEEFNQ